MGETWAARAERGRLEGKTRLEAITDMPRTNASTWVEPGALSLASVSLEDSESGFGSLRSSQYDGDDERQERRREDDEDDAYDERQNGYGREERRSRRSSDDGYQNGHGREERRSRDDDYEERQPRARSRDDDYDERQPRARGQNGYRRGERRRR